MPAESKESKAKKLAAARKKLKEYQKRSSEIPTTTIAGGDINTGEIGASSAEQHTETTPTTAEGSISSNLSEKSVSELSLNSAAAAATPRAATTPTEAAAAAADAVLETALTSVSSYFQATPVQEPLIKCALPAAAAVPVAQDYQVDVSTPAPQSINAMQLLIAEKTQISAELNKCRTACRERDLELEELRTLYAGASARIEELQQCVISQQQSTEQLRHSNAELQHALAQSNAASEDRIAHCTELQRQLDMTRERADALEQSDKDASNALEMAQLRIRQLSDEAAFGIVGGKEDSRIETLTQTQFMYEQQIRDLQAMVQQLSQDKEQASTQYQNYVQHLNVELAALNERNSESQDQCAKLQERERQLVEHIGGLEREIQRNITRQEQQKEEEQRQQETSTTNAPELTKEIDKLTEQFNDYSFERHEFQLKIKSQEDRLEQLNAALQQKHGELELLQERLANLSAVQPDQTKLLATMESDKVAASRALTQNVALKQQLDELELRFVQLTNDKADLVNERDAEEYANREMRSNYAALEERVRTIDERFKFKDEEMIRLSHENMKLTHKNLILQQQVDRLQHYEVREYSDKYKSEENDEILKSHEHDHHDHHDHDNHDHDNHGHDHDHHDHDHHGHNYHDHDQHDHQRQENGENNTEPHSENSGDSSSCHEATEESGEHEHQHDHQHDHQQQHDEHDHGAPVVVKLAPALHHQHHQRSPHMPTSEAVEKLQHRFTQLMSQVAELTDEKQRLEHLVLQLQSETETIGEYITLYQTQRRVLKQREYEKAAQTQLLQAEREQMREKITLLNNLVSSLGVEMPIPAETTQNALGMKEHLNAALAQSVSIEPAAAEGQALLNVSEQGSADTQLLPSATGANLAMHQKLNTNESQEILSKIQNIISEIKENATKEVPTLEQQTHTADHLTCCMGKFETV